MWQGWHTGPQLEIHSLSVEKATTLISDPVSPSRAVAENAEAEENKDELVPDFVTA